MSLTFDHLIKAEVKTEGVCYFALRTSFITASDKKFRHGISVKDYNILKNSSKILHNSKFKKKSIRGLKAKTRPRV